MDTTNIELLEFDLNLIRPNHFIAIICNELAQSDSFCNNLISTLGIATIIRDINDVKVESHVAQPYISSSFLTPYTSDMELELEKISLWHYRANLLFVLLVKTIGHHPSPEIRINMDVVFLFPDNNMDNLMLLYDKYGGILPDFTLFLYAMNVCYQKNIVLVINYKSNKIYYCKM